MLQNAFHAIESNPLMEAWGLSNSNEISTLSEMSLIVKTYCESRCPFSEVPIGNFKNIAIAVEDNNKIILFNKKFNRVGMPTGTYLIITYNPINY